MKKLIISFAIIFAASTAIAGNPSENSSVIIDGYIGVCNNVYVPDTFSITEKQTELKLSLYLMQYQARPDEPLPRTRKRLNCDVIEALLVYEK